jgi:hypothetical protein
MDTWKYICEKVLIELIFNVSICYENSEVPQTIECIEKKKNE